MTRRALEAFNKALHARFHSIDSTHPLQKDAAAWCTGSRRSTSKSRSSWQCDRPTRSVLLSKVHTHKPPTLKWLPTQTLRLIHMDRPNPISQAFPCDLNKSQSSERKCSQTTFVVQFPNFAQQAMLTQFKQKPDDD